MTKNLIVDFISIGMFGTRFEKLAAEVLTDVGPRFRRWLPGRYTRARKLLKSDLIRFEVPHGPGAELLGPGRDSVLRPEQQMLN